MLPGAASLSSWLLSDTGLLCCHGATRILSHPAEQQLMRKAPPQAIAQGPVSMTIPRISIVGQGTGTGGIRSQAVASPRAGMGAGLQATRLPRGSAGSRW